MLRLLTSENYTASRHLIKSGDLLAWSRTGFISRLVRAWTGSTYSHVGVAWVVAGRVFVLEALDGKGVVIRPLSNLLPVYHVDVGVIWTQERENFALKHVGESYSFLDAIRAGFGLQPKHKGWQCVEYASAVIGYEVDNHDPETLVNIALKKAP